MTGISFLAFALTGFRIAHITFRFLILAITFLASLQWFAPIAGLALLAAQSLGVSTKTKSNGARLSTWLIKVDLDRTYGQIIHRPVAGSQEPPLQAHRVQPEPISVGSPK